MADKVGTDGRVFRSASFKVKAIDEAAAEGDAVVSKRYRLSVSNLANWRKKDKTLRKLARKDEAQALKVSNQHATEEPAPVSSTTVKRDPSTKTQITGLAMMIAEIRATVIKELATELEPIIEGIVDQRMGELVAREIKRALESKAA